MQVSVIETREGTCVDVYVDGVAESFRWNEGLHRFTRRDCDRSSYLMTSEPGALRRREDGSVISEAR